MRNAVSSTSTSGVLKVLIKRELILAFRRPQDLANPLVFFVLVTSLFPLGVSPEPSFLQPAAAGLVWVAALLATMLSLDRLFRSDYDDGSLEQLVLCGHPLFLLSLVKLIVAWCLTGLPLVLMSPVMAVMMHLPSDQIPVLALSLLLGTPILSLIGAIGAALTLGVRGGDVLLSLLVLPLYVPALVFGAGAVQAEISGLGASAHLSILAAMALVAAVFSPWASAASLRIALES